MNKKKLDSTGKLIEFKSAQISRQICPTDMRKDPVYYAIYYTYMYTTFMAIGPLILLIVLNLFVITCVIKKGTNSGNFNITSLKF